MIKDLWLVLTGKLSSHELQSHRVRKEYLEQKCDQLLRRVAEMQNNFIATDAGYAKAKAESDILAKETISRLRGEVYK